MTYIPKPKVHHPSLKANATTFKAQFRTFGACVSKKS